MAHSVPGKYVRRTYVARLSKADGGLKSFGLLSSATAGECSFEALTQCTDEVLDFEAVAKYRNYRLPEQFREAVWQKIAEQVDADCLEVCGADETCTVKADCVVDDVRLSASVEETIIGADATSYMAEFRLKRSVSVEAADGIDGWTRASCYDEIVHSDSFYDGSYVSHAAEISWDGLLSEDLPEDSGLAMSYRNSNSAAASIAYEYNAGTCDIRWDYDLGEAWPDTFESDLVAINGRSYRIVQSETDADSWLLFADDDCVSEVDPETWQSIGPCDV